MPLRIGRSYFRSRAFAADTSVGRELLLGVWDINHSTNSQHYAHPYLTHCNELRSLFEEVGLSKANRTDIVELVKLVKRNQNKTIEEIEDEISNANFHWINPLTRDDSIRYTFDFAIRLWLFIEPDLSDRSLTLPEVVERCLPRRFQLRRYQKKAKKSHTVSTPTWSISALASSGRLSKDEDSSLYLPVDFSEKSLARKGGIKLEWTSYLADHLSFAGKSRLRVFRHASAIQQYSNPAINLPYPPGFLQETERTLALLFDPSGRDTAKRTRRIERRSHVDLEAAINSLEDSDARLELRKYPYWQERLKKISKVYEDTQPKCLRQWWFDRRNRFNWVTFWTAAVIFFLTLIFGLISCVTGIMQVYASFKALQPHPTLM